MPFIVEVRRRSVLVTNSPAEPNDVINVPVSRLAVATLEEAREAAQAPMLERAMGYAPDSWKTNWQVAKELPESGGTVGPLPDGTVIEVEALGAIDLFNRAGLSKGPPYLTVAEVIAAFNAKFAPSPSVAEEV